MAKHAILSPSSADRWMSCPGSVLLSIGQPDDESEYAREGTNYHTLAEMCLKQDLEPTDLVGMAFEDDTIVTEENAEHVQTYVNLVRELAAQGGTLLVEQKIPIGALTGELDEQGKVATGTADAVIIREDEIVIVDLKFGRGVAVKAEGNRQGRTYAAGAVEEHQLWDTIKRVRIIIVQPRVMDGTSEETISIEELKLFRDELFACANPILRSLQTKEKLPLIPSEKACQFCRAKSVCPELYRAVEEATSDGFEDLSKDIVDHTGDVVETGADRLGAAMRLADLCEIYIKGVRAAVESELLTGRPVTGFKLVRGKKGNRKWADDKKIEELMKKTWRMKKDDMYTFKLITPTSAEKYFKDDKKRWGMLSEQITQSDGSLTIAPAEDPRPAAVLEAQDAGFEDVSLDGVW